jgi:hypothetical protein
MGNVGGGSGSGSGGGFDVGGSREGGDGAQEGEGEGVVVRERLEGALALLVGGRLSALWSLALCEALGPTASALHHLTALACHTHAGLLERLALVFEMHAGSRTARLSEAALHRLTRTLLALALAPTDTEPLLAPPPPDSDESGDDDDDDDDDDIAEMRTDELVFSLQRPMAHLRASASAPCAARGPATQRGRAAPSQPRTLKGVTSLVLCTSRLALINRHAQRITRLLQHVSSSAGGGISLHEWREGCLSQPELLNVFDGWSMHSGRAAGAPEATPTPQRGAPHAFSPLARVSCGPDEVPIF